RRIAGRWRAQFGKRAAAGAAVACLALALAGPDLALRLQADHMTGTGAIRTVTLADGSTAVLDSRSAIAVDYRSGERRVTLLR
ncbi:iron dicitrate transport regulator FecR, partial [Klebsiella pneumoniae]|nr:iron dicitrate transport regulator FecR [Klebsiella pneumoniae]